jgi:hypothetical protein
MSSFITILFTISERRTHCGVTVTKQVLINTTKKKKSAGVRERKERGREPGGSERASERASSTLHICMHIVHTRYLQ